MVRQIDTHNLGKTIGRQRLKLVPVAGAALEKSMRDQVEYGLGIDGTQEIKQFHQIVDGVRHADIANPPHHWRHIAQERPLAFIPR